MGCGCGSSESVTVVIPSDEAATVAVTSSVVTGMGSLTAGARSVSFYNFGGGDCTVNGQILPQGAGISFPYLGRNIKYGSIPYNASGTSLRIDRSDF